MKRVLVTGSTGFVGQRLLGRLRATANVLPVAVMRQASVTVAPGVIVVDVPDITPTTNWHEIVAGTNVVIHTAARVHMRESSSFADALFQFRRINVEATLNLARQAATHGVERFIFLSSIKVNGESTVSGETFSAEDAPNPSDAYGISKSEAEIELQRLAATSNMDVVILRPPLVYGPGVKANFLSMMSWVHRGAPLPLGLIKNRRSLVALDNLVDLIVTCLDSPAAANQIFLVCDGEDLSTPELLRRLGKFLGRDARLLNVPRELLLFGSKMIGRPELFSRLCGSLQIDMSKTLKMLAWSPPLTAQQGLQSAAEYFLALPRR
jgi:nucleoside-diphosphate-sugar epimerase